VPIGTQLKALAAEAAAPVVLLMNEVAEVELAMLLRGAKLCAQLTVAVVKDELVVTAATMFCALEAGVCGSVAVALGFCTHAVPRGAVTTGNVALRTGGAVAALLVERGAVALARGTLPARRGRDTGFTLPVVQRTNHDWLVDVVFAELDEHFLADGGYSWNSGMFLFKAADFLDELQAYRPDIADPVAQAVAKGYEDLDFCRLDPASFEATPSESIDYAVMEKTRRAVVVLADIGWSDVGSWSALWAVQESDENGNVQRGDVHLQDVTNTLVRAESRLVSALGVDDLIIVETDDAVLVAHKDKVQDVKKVVDQLKAQGRTEPIHHKRVYRPWGSYESVASGERFQVKRIIVKPGEKLSLQMHHHRAEHWVVVSGTALVTRGEEVKLLSENESIYLPIGVTHRLENPGKLPLHLIEVQSGSYLGEDDIVRFDDVYKRA